MKGKRHLDFYKENSKYADFLSSVDFSLYNKYLNKMKPEDKGHKVLDMGCGIGRVVNELSKEWQNIYGIDVSEKLVGIARGGKGKFRVFDGNTIPFRSNYFDKVGCFTVLEHVENPVRLIREMARVVKKQGTIIIGAPNFLRVIGFSVTHPHNRGVKRSVLNLVALSRKYVYCKFSPKKMKFDFMKPLVKDGRPINADDDAICVTNLVDVKYFLGKRKIRIIYQSGLVNFHKSSLINFLSKLPVVRAITGGFFLVGTKR